MKDVQTARADSVGAGAPADEIEVTPEMIEAGMNFMLKEGVAGLSLSTRIPSPEFIADFCRAILAARRPASGDAH